MLIVLFLINIKTRLKLDNGNATDEKGLKTFDSLIDRWSFLFTFHFILLQDMQALKLNCIFWFIDYNEIRGDMKRIQLMRVCFEAVKSIMGVEFLSKLSIQQLMSVFGKVITGSFIY